MSSFEQIEQDAALNKKILYLLNEKSVSGESSGRATVVYTFMKSPTATV